MMARLKDVERKILHRWSEDVGGYPEKRSRLFQQTCGFYIFFATCTQKKVSYEVITVQVNSKVATALPTAPSPLCLRVLSPSMHTHNHTHTQSYTYTHRAAPLLFLVVRSIFPGAIVTMWRSVVGAMSLVGKKVQVVDR